MRYPICPFPLLLDLISTIWAKYFSDFDNISNSLSRIRRLFYTVFHNNVPKYRIAAQKKVRLQKKMFEYRKVYLTITIENSGQDFSDRFVLSFELQEPI